MSTSTLSARLRAAADRLDEMGDFSAAPAVLVANEGAHLHFQNATEAVVREVVERLPGAWVTSSTCAYRHSSDDVFRMVWIYFATVAPTAAFDGESLVASLSPSEVAS